VLGGDDASFELLMRRYNQRLFRVARGMLGDDAEAEDAVQEAYVQAYEHLRQFEGRSRFSTWLTKIAVYEASARRRKRRRLRIIGLSDDETHPMASPPTHRDVVEQASQQELRQVLAGAVDALPAELRVVFTLRMVERLSTNQTAECLAITPANVKVRLHRARGLLRSWIDNRIGEEARLLYQCAGDRCDRIVAKVGERLARARG
jgi:RNA polymerase sigma-70 factor (ECF subfamily)